MSKEVVAIIGAGIAGAATAYFLALKGLRNILLLEKEKMAGARSTGRNAAILRTTISDPLISGLAKESANFYRHPPEGFASNTLIDPVGVCLAARAEYVKTLRSWCDNNRPGSKSQFGDAVQLYQRIPVLAPGLSAVAYEPEEGVIDVHSILQGYIRGACRKGAELHLACEVKSLTIRDGRVMGLETSDGFIEATQIVIANGGWAATVPAAAGYPLPLIPHRRHLIVTEPLPQVNPRWPVVWVIGDEFYFRPESGGLLMSGCDTVKVTPEQGETTDPTELERIAEKAAIWLPSLTEARIANAWAGMRTLAPDNRFVVGTDPRLPGLHWVAALGGHGITCAPSVGAIAADWIADGSSSHHAAAALSPQRFLA